jgi:hypothetical protein
MRLATRGVVWKLGFWISSSMERNSGFIDFLKFLLGFTELLEIKLGFFEEFLDSVPEDSSVAANLRQSDSGWYLSGLNDHRVASAFYAVPGFEIFCTLPQGIL